MLKLSSTVFISESELKFSYHSSPGPGGQNVNKTATAVLLRFNILQSTSLSEEIKNRLLEKLAKRVTHEGDILIRAHRFRTQERNKQDAIGRFVEMLSCAIKTQRKRKKTKPTYASVQKRLAKKKLHAIKKNLRDKKLKFD